MIANKSFEDNATDLAEQAAQTTDNVIKSTQRAANSAFDGMSDSVQDVKSEAIPLVSRLSSQAEQLAQRSVEAVRNGSAQIRESAVRASDTTIGYIKDEPVKSMLIAAATGAALMALVGLLSRSRDRL